MDGNGRWAKKRFLPRSMGHKKGVDAVRKIVKKAAESGISFLTLYAFSTENWKRPKEEVISLMKLFLQTIDGELNELICNGVSLKFIGLKDKLSKTMLEKINYAEQHTKGGALLKVNIALNYSSRSELVYAFRQIRAKGVDAVDITEEMISANLFTAGCPDPDLVIRTGGEHRLSNFLLWQTVYSELYFTNILWPDFNEADLEEALKAYSDRERRYGGLR